MTFEEIIQELRAIANPEIVQKKQSKFGIMADNALGIYHKDLKQIAKRIPHDDELAMQLFDSNIYEARLLCSKLFNPKNVTEALMERWVQTFENWEICDSFSMGIFARSAYAGTKSIEWSSRVPEFQKRAGFATIAALSLYDKQGANDAFEQFFPYILRESTDHRLYVKKAVNWALRNIGKRNQDLNQMAVEISRQLSKYENKTARWIGSNALKELTKDRVRISDYPREIYRG